MPIPKPSEPIAGEGIELLPMAVGDADQVEQICDLEGLQALSQDLGLTECRWARLWAHVLALRWEPPDDMWLQTAVAIRTTDRLNELAGIVGLNRFHRVLNRAGLNVFYWIAPNRRGNHLAAKAVVLATPWALDAWGESDAFIHATNPASKAVAERAGFELTDEVLGGAPMYHRPRLG